MPFTCFNSRDIKHKSVFGSIAAGEIQRLCVVMPRSFCCSSVKLVFHKDGCEERIKELYWCGQDNESEENWDISFSYSEPGLYYYHFVYETPFGGSTILLQNGGFGTFSPYGSEWQQTVYDKSFKTPDWIKGGIMYQIFPDRFYNSGKHKNNVPKDRIIHKSINELPVYLPDENGKILNNDYFGGDLKGIEEKLPYLSSLGVSVIYLNPIFEAHSNHRYNTADYTKIDSLLGDEEDLKSLVLKAEKYGIAVILDGVFSHTGSDSIYFNREKRYGDGGAFNDIKSVYREWYKFKENNTYDSWWGIDTLPETDEENESFIDFITGEKGIAEKWLSCGIKGFRLDVADELPDKFLDRFYASLKEYGNDLFILGEVWEDASNKISHGGRRKFLLGHQLDSVMNYPFADAILRFMRYGVAEDFCESIATICENYPKPVLDCLMNHLGTHDTARLLTRLVYPDLENKPREIQAQHKLTQEEYKRAKILLKTATVIQYTLPGFPSLYYGDEAGLTGGRDPFNRCFFPWDNADTDLTEWFIKLGKIRKSLICLKDGIFKPLSATLSCVAYERISEQEKILVIINRNPHEIDYYLPDDYKYKKELITNSQTEEFVKVPENGAVIIIN